MTRDELKKRIEAIETGYEFFLAYAAQGLSGEAAERSDAQVREYLHRAADALTGLADGCDTLVANEALEPRDAYDGLLAVLRADADHTRAALRFVDAQPSISSQLIDNLNASIHVRALLTDLFLWDEALNPQAVGSRGPDG